MKSKGYIENVIQYVTEHPGCYLTHIEHEAKIPRGSTATILVSLTRAKVLRREGFERRYRYYLVDPEERPVTAPKKRPSLAAQSTVNPLTNLFNQRLAQVRSGR
ncbi:hypothetical protein [Lelliottia sp. T2.26D-8]|uniref:hypothetical protein n=1 Tax=Lelliottia sp. T2.26D-8 TaxID=3041165 RepID=UPI002477BA70|nr:hypothetical protein [Lelliottia sp. T2.26D-8]CAI9399314.1 hypothetical protein CCAJJPOJ_00194 [Lelliottia sp. T2.26D-8]